MNHVERIKAVMNFEPVDRLPMMEWAEYWNVTLDRWKTEGLPEPLGSNSFEIRKWAGLDAINQSWLSPAVGALSAIGGKVTGDEDYDAIRDQLFIDRDFSQESYQQRRREHEAGDTALWFSLHGFFWFPRTLFGVEEHLFAFYDQADLMHRMNNDLVDYNIGIIEKYCAEVGTPEFITLAEDMSYNNGPMLGKDLFDEFLLPYYRKIVPRLKEKGIKVLVDSDGDVSKMIPWLVEAGVDGLLPWEKQSGVDVVKIREKHPDFLMIGAFDKLCMNQGEEAVRAEFERLLPLMRQGGFIPSPDHQTPPAVSLAQYRQYLEILREYAHTSVDSGDIRRLVRQSGIHGAEANLCDGLEPG